MIGARLIVIFQGAVGARAQGAVGFGIRQRNFSRSPHRDRFEIFRAHHRAQPRAPGGAAVIAEDAREQDSLFRGGTHTGDARPRDAQLLFDGFLRLVSILPPNLRGFADLEPASV